MNNLKKLTYTGLLIALSITIPLVFGFLKIQIGPFSATLASHVPLFVSMFLSPVCAAMVGLGSALGFLISTPLVVASRAFMHTFVGFIGGYLIKKEVSFKKVIIVTAPVHGLLEAIAVIPFGFTVYKILIVVGLGSILHHITDGVITLVLIKALSKNSNKNFNKLFFPK
ncbi:ECF transporter S component [Clostridium niameyense]|uniref:ECF transporter S component n=1 Tax=Clostridium niameyense TaxID=1622073 RepID=A0A6M0R6Q7_9CLOT|nr:ECF transporter S component [Clostridium niameyense]NEZ45932.1 ECF transporter S component [Clostridium niameyense]